MASKSRKFWVETVHTRDDPPASWTRVIGCRLSESPTDAVQEAVIARAEEWLRGDELAGYYCWVTAAYGSRDALDIDYAAFMFAFSDPNTAFEFKLRFG